MKTFLTFTRQVMHHVGRRRATRPELQRIQQWWHESHDCCPEAIAMEIQQVVPEWTLLRQIAQGK